MAFAAGHGGSTSFAGVTLHNSEWELEWEQLWANITNSGSGGYRQKIAVIKDWKGTVMCPWDDANIPGTDVATGAGTFIGNIGSTGKFYTGTILVTGIRLVNNNDDDAVRVEVSFEGNGTLTMPVT